MKGAFTFGGGYAMISLIEDDLLWMQINFQDNL